MSADGGFVADLVRGKHGMWVTSGCNGSGSSHRRKWGAHWPPVDHQWHRQATAVARQVWSAARGGTGLRALERVPHRGRKPSLCRSKIGFGFDLRLLDP